MAELQAECSAIGEAGECHCFEEGFLRREEKTRMSRACSMVREGEKKVVKTASLMKQETENAAQGNKQEKGGGGRSNR